MFFFFNRRYQHHTFSAFFQNLKIVIYFFLTKRLATKSMTPIQTARFMSVDYTRLFPNIFLFNIQFTSPNTRLLLQKSFPPFFSERSLLHNASWQHSFLILMNASLQHFATTLVQVILHDSTTFSPKVSFPTFLFNILFSTLSSASLNTALLYDMSLQNLSRIFSTNFPKTSLCSISQVTLSCD